VACTSTGTSSRPFGWVREPAVKGRATSLWRLFARPIGSIVSLTPRFSHSVLAQPVSACDAVNTICHSIKKERRGAQCPSNSEQKLMKALFLYVLFVMIGASISVGIGYYVEREVSSTASLIVFLLLFFSNFVVSWNRSGTRKAVKRS
jgi:hypothetical protein